MRIALGGLTREAEAIRRSGTFDEVWYRERCRQLSKDEDAILHYVREGWKQGLIPHPLFLNFWYFDTNPDLKSSGLSPLGHFVLLGEAMGRSPSVLFDPAWYRAQLPLQSSLPSSLFHHFLTGGFQGGLSPHPAFETDFYFRQHPSLKHEGVNPLTHFVEGGAAAGYWPNSLFDTPWYMASNPDVAKSGINPLVHFLLFGAREGRSPHPDVDLVDYIEFRQRRGDEVDASQAYLDLLQSSRKSSAVGMAERIVATPQRHQSYAGSARARLIRSGLFDKDVYLGLHQDLRDAGVDALDHFLKHGIKEGRHFTSSELVARLLAEHSTEKVLHALGAEQTHLKLTPVSARSLRVGVFYNTSGNFFMKEIAELLKVGLVASGCGAHLRTDEHSLDEDFDIRIFVAPHEYFFLGAGERWLPFVGHETTALYNVEQPQTQWFCRTFDLLLKSSLVIDINPQTTALLRRAGCNAVYFCPGYLEGHELFAPVQDVSDLEIFRGYSFATEAYDWKKLDLITDRPIDVAFVGSSSPRRDKILARLLGLSDLYRFFLVYTKQSAPLVSGKYRTTSTHVNRALGQRSKIVLNIHRDWMGYFEWSRLVLQGIWQGACVVTEPCLDNPDFIAGEDFLEDDSRHLGELVRWLLSTKDGRQRMEVVRRNAFNKARDRVSMQVALQPLMHALVAMRKVNAT